MTRRLAIIAVALLVFVAAFVLKTSQRRGGEPDPTPSAAQTRNAPLPRLVDLGANKCIPCKKMAPILEELSHEYRGVLSVEVIDVWKDPEAGRPYGVRVIPTQIFFDASGRERFRHEGFMAKEAILEKWKELGVELKTPAPGTGAN